jgi:hypothetical protein
MSKDAPELKKLLTIENKRGGHLSIRANTRKPEEGPFMVTGTDSRGRNTRMVGDEAFLLKWINDWPQFRPEGTPSLLDPEVIRARLRAQRLGEQAAGS